MHQANSYHLAVCVAGEHGFLDTKCRAIDRKFYDPIFEGSELLSSVNNIK